MPPGQGNKNMQRAIKDAFGDDPAVISAVQNLLGSSSAGQRGPLDAEGGIGRILANSDPKDLETLMNAIGNRDKKSDLELEGFNYKKVPVKRNSFSVVQLMHMGFETRDKKMSETYVPGSQPAFQVVIYDENSSFRITDAPEAAGLPSSKFVLNCIQRAIASPLPPLRPSLPELLLIALKFEPHIPALRPFLDSLPVPFTWRLETPEEAAEVADGVSDLNIAGVARGLRSAKEEKNLGNQAVARKNRKQAIKHYSEAIGWLLDAFSQKPDEKERKEIDELWSVCLANRAAAYLMEGEGRDPKKALEDALEARKYDENYGKAYYRQAKAHQLLNEPNKAIEVLITALRKPSLAKDKGLNDTLIELYGGLPSTESELKEFCPKVFNGSVSVDGLAELRHRVDEHVKTIIGPGASVQSLLA